MIEIAKPQILGRTLCRPDAATRRHPGRLDGQRAGEGTSLRVHHKKYRNGAFSSQTTVRSGCRRRGRRQRTYGTMLRPRRKSGPGAMLDRWRFGMSRCVDHGGQSRASEQRPVRFSWSQHACRLFYPRTRGSIAAKSRISSLYPRYPCPRQARRGRVNPGSSNESCCAICARKS